MASLKTTTRLHCLMRKAKPLCVLHITEKTSVSTPKLRIIRATFHSDAFCRKRFDKQTIKESQRFCTSRISSSENSSICVQQERSFTGNTDDDDNVEITMPDFIKNEADFVLHAKKEVLEEYAKKVRSLSLTMSL